MNWQTMRLTNDDEKRLRIALEPIVVDMMERAATPEERALYLHSLCDNCGLSIWMIASKLKRERVALLKD